LASENTKLLASLASVWKNVPIPLPNVKKKKRKEKKNALTDTGDVEESPVGVLGARDDVGAQVVGALQVVLVAAVEIECAAVQSRVWSRQGQSPSRQQGCAAVYH
jgi:hypothetical protein